MMDPRFCDHAKFFVITNVDYSAASRQLLGNWDDTADNRAIKQQTAAALQRIRARQRQPKKG
jgi:hypothetical protein